MSLQARNVHASPSSKRTTQQVNTTDLDTATDGDACLFVYNLPPSTDETVFRKRFDCFGPIKEARIARWPGNSQKNAMFSFRY